MEQASPARLYATLVGAALVVFGILGFFYSASFGSPGSVDEMLGVFATNGWDNVLHVLTGAVGLLLAGFAARRYALLLGAFYVLIAVWAFLIGGGEAILGFLPVSTADNLLHLILGGLGLAAVVGTEKRVAPPPVANPRESETGALGHRA
jgi:hypothetical protein